MEFVYGGRRPEGIAALGKEKGTGEVSDVIPEFWTLNLEGNIW